MAAKYSIGDFSKKTGTTIRTLHYYDEIGILKPSYVSEKGRRSYSDTDIITLQKIVTLKFLGYSLEQIQELFQSEVWDLKDSLHYQKQMMLEKKKQIEDVVRALDHALHVIDVNETVDPSIFIMLINNIQMEEKHKEWFKEYLDEGRVEEIFNVPDDKQKELEKVWVQVTHNLKTLYGTDPRSDVVQKLIDQLMLLVRDIAGDEYSILRELSQAEVKEEESWLFHSPFSKEEEEWVSKALSIYLENKGFELDVNSNPQV